MTCTFRQLLLAALFLVPAPGSAQILDFDSQCASPPCTLATQYSALGITFVPNPGTQAAIVAAGTDGLTGTSGLRLVRVTTAPAQLVINLNRRATSFSLNAARAGSSSGTITLSVTFFNNGVQVGATQQATLSIVDNWTNLAFQDFGGFDSILLDPSGGADNTFGIDTLQFGGRCNGFSDVALGDIYCNATEWLANRSVTLGCGLPGQYCPADGVTRAQMALFMNRLGTALIPRLFVDEDVTPPAWNSAPDTGAYMCGVSRKSFPTPKVALVRGIVAVRANGAANLWVIPRMSINGAAFGNISGYWDKGGTTGTADVHVSTSSTAVDLVPGRSYTFSLYALRNGGSGTFDSGSCKLTVEIFDSSSFTAPFDAAGTQRPPQPNSTP